MSLLNKILGGLGTLVTAYVIESEMQRYDTEIFGPIDTISIILPVLNEKQYIEIALSSILNQSIISKYPDKFELLIADSCSTDGTITKIQDILENENIPIKSSIIIVPRGKLSARNRATDEARGNILVSIDADTYYPPMWLNELLEPFNNISNPEYENVVAISGSTFDNSTGIPGPLFSLGDFLYNKLINTHRIVGRADAVFKHVHYLSGGFDESVDQTQIWKIFKEEENLYGQRLSQFGKIVYKLSASCVHLGGSKSMNRLINKKEYKKDRDTF